MMALCDGTRLALLASSEDHKAVGDGDVGPNTGGMGTVSPSALIDDAAAQRILETLFVPDGARADRGRAAVPRPALRRPDADARSRPDGDRMELPLRRSGDAVGADALRRRSAALAGGRRGGRDARRARRAPARASRCAWCWPPAAIRRKPRAGDAITGLPPRSDDLVVFHAGTRRDARRSAGDRGRARAGRDGVRRRPGRGARPRLRARSTASVSMVCISAETSACEGRHEHERSETRCGHHDGVEVRPRNHAPRRQGAGEAWVWRSRCACCRRTARPRRPPRSSRTPAAAG